MRVRWTKPAREQLRRVRDWIARDNVRVAAAMSQRIVARTQALSRFPYLGRSGRIEGARELVLGGTPYIVRYTVVGSEVQIDKLWHASRLVEED